MLYKLKCKIKSMTTLKTNPLTNSNHTLLIEHVNINEFTDLRRRKPISKVLHVL